MFRFILPAVAALGAGSIALAVPSASMPNVVTITARDFAFEAPDTVAAGWTTVRLVNSGPDMHHIWMLRLKDGHTMADLYKTMNSPGPQPAWAEDVGGPNSPVPGGVVEATLLLEPGAYAIICVIPGPDGVPHVVKGMAHGLTVVGPAQSAPAPEADVTVTLSDYDFTMSKPLAAGTQTLRFRNTAAQPHEMFIARLAPGKTPGDLLGWIEKREGPPPAEPLGGITGIAPGREIVIPLTLTKGDYALICFVPDAKDGKPHLAHGMVKTVTVS